jgi:hypothetical protein
MFLLAIRLFGEIDYLPAGTKKFSCITPQLLLLNATSQFKFIKRNPSLQRPLFIHSALR